MDYNEIVTIISGVGFPIFSCIYMFKIMQNLTEALNELRITLTELSVKITGEGIENENK